MPVPSRAVVTPDPTLLRSALGATPFSLQPIAGGYTRSRTWRAETSAGSVFVKEATEEGSLAMIRREALVYQRVDASFLPRFVGFADEGDRALLALEHVADAFWPPPYPDDVEPLFETLAAVAATAPPPGLPHVSRRRPSWVEVANNPEPLLGLGLCSGRWLETSLEALIRAEACAEWLGESLVHHDVYSGNVCFRGGHALLIDWGAASIGSPSSDVAFALMSLRSERARIPDVRLPDEGAWAAALTAHFAVETVKPLPAWSDPTSTLRSDMARDLAAGLQWCVETLGLPPLR